MADQKKIVIIGGVAGGATCSSTFTRLDEHARIILIERVPTFRLPTVDFLIISEKLSKNAKAYS